MWIKEQLKKEVIMRKTLACLLVRNQIRNSCKRTTPLFAYIPNTQLSKQEWKAYVKEDTSKEKFFRTRPHVDYIPMDGVE